jgi:hypothetical protein
VVGIADPIVSRKFYKSPSRLVAENAPEGRFNSIEHSLLGKLDLRAQSVSITARPPLPICGNSVPVCLRLTTECFPI